MDRLWIVTAVSLAACAVEPQVSATTQATTLCPEFVCGGNDPIVDTHPAHDFAIDGSENAGHLSLATSNGRAQIWSAADIAYDLVLKDGRLVGQRTGAPDLSGNNNGLEGAYMILLLDGKPTYYLVIERTSWRNFVIGRPDEFEAYKFSWSFYKQGPSPDKLLCNKPPEDDPNYEKSTELLGIRADESVVFVGDRIDGISKTFFGYDKKWFNIGCAAHVLAKTYLTRSTTQSKDADAAPWWGQEQFQSTLKMYCADYCGTGKPFTVSGQHIVFTDAAGLVAYWALPTKYESRWDREGATCLDRPRRIDDEPNIRAEIDAECIDVAHRPALESCDGDGSFVDFQGTDRISAYSSQNP